MIPSTLPTVVESLGWTILHFVWQGGAAAAVLFGLLAATRRAAPQVRYGLACAALLVAVAAFVGTLAWQIEIARPEVATSVASAEPVAELVATAELPSAAGPAGMSPLEIESAVSLELRLEPADLLPIGDEPWPQRLRGWLPLVDAIWAAGVALLSLRLCVSWQAVRRLCHSASAIDDPAWSERFAALGRRLDISRPVRLLSSTAAGVPFVVGCLRPMILVPAGLLSGLTPVEVNAILAHELAHVRRHDFAVNLLQNVAETVLFYHPAVWWLSAQIRREREHCCDDVAAAVCGGALDYAKALVAVEQLRPAGNLLVAASGGSLVARIRRLADAGADRSAGSTWPPVALVLLLSAALAVVAVARLSSAEPQGNRAPIAVDEPTEKPAGAEAGLEASESPNDPADPGIVVTVLDAQTGERVPKFRILAGANTGTSTWWLAATIREGKNGAAFWPAKDCNDETMFRVEADGYQPARSAWIGKPQGAVAVVLRLAKASPVDGRVLQPDGKPAIGATLAIGLGGKSAALEDGRIRGDGEPLPANPVDRWLRPILVKTDGDGRFRLPDETDPAAAVLIVHESGAGDTPLAELREHPEIRLEPWGRVVGQVWWKDHAGADETIHLYLDRNDDARLLSLSGLTKKRTGPDGRFEFTKVLPGRIRVSRPIELPKKHDPNGMQSVGFDGQISEVKAGETIEVHIGGKGRTVRGRLTGRDEISSGSSGTVTITCAPNGGSVGPGIAGSMLAGLSLWRVSPTGPLFFREPVKVAGDGSFGLANVLPGGYEIRLSLSEPTPHEIGTCKFQVEPERQGEVPEPVDLGELEVEPLRRAGDAGEPNGDGRIPIRLPVEIRVGRDRIGRLDYRVSGRHMEPTELGKLLGGIAEVDGKPSVELTVGSFGASKIDELSDFLKRHGLRQFSFLTVSDADDERPTEPAEAGPRGAAIPAAEPAAEIDVPASGPPAGDVQPRLRFTLSRESGETVLRLSGQKIDEQTLHRLTRAVVDGQEGPAVLLAADQAAPYPEVVKVLDLLSSLGLKKIALETRRATGDGKPAPPLVGVPARFSGAEVIALVGPEVILASDVLPDANAVLERARERNAANPPTAEETDNLRKLYMSKFLEHLIDIKLVVIEARHLIPKEAWQKVEKQFGAQFDKEYLPGLIEAEHCKSRTDLDRKLRQSGGSLEGLKRQSMENSFAQTFLQEKLKTTTSAEDLSAYRKAHPELGEADETTIRKQIAEERRSELRQKFLAQLRKRIPVWTIFADADQTNADAERPDASATESSSATPPPPRPDDAAAATWGTVKLVVTDSQKKPIPRFRVMTGIRPRQVAGDLSPPANWALFPVIIGQNGACDWTPKQGGKDDEYLLEIEAEGYESNNPGAFAPPIPPQTIEVELHLDTPVTLQVFEPSIGSAGQPAAGATVAIPEAYRHAILENAHIRGDSYAAFQNEIAHWGQPAFEAMRLDRPWLVKTDGDGRCTIPDSARFGPLLIVHPSGAILITNELSQFNANDLRKPGTSLPTHLRPWAVVQGKVLWRDQAGVGERIGLSTEYFGGMISRGPDDMTTDESGSFEFRHVLPGLVHLTRFVTDDDGKLPAGKRFSFPGLDTYVTAAPMVATYAQIGGRGRTVVGRLVGRKDWSGVSVSFAPALSAQAESDASGTIKKLRDQWADSPIGPIFFRHDFQPSANGSFELPRVLPGRYELTVSTPEMPKGAAARAEVSIDPENSGEERPRIDLGDIDVAAQARLGIELKAGELYRGDVDTF